jgi:hypothetical protein
MNMEAFLWMFLPVFVAGGSALLCYFVMQSRMEVAVAKERETLAEARAMLSSHKVTVEERVKATEEACKRQALDDFMQDIRTEERSYVRELKSGNGSRKTMVMQERLFFRNIPLSNWIEHEMLIEEGVGELPAASAASVFTTATLPSPIESRPAISKLLHEVKANEPKTSDSKRSQEPKPSATDLISLHNRLTEPQITPEATDSKPAIVIHAAAFGAQ